MKLDNLSIEQIREQFLQGNQPVTAQFLNKLGRDPREGVRKIHELLKKRYEKEQSERLRILNMLNFERVLWKSGIQSVAGVDEAGTGPLAGPVVAAAVVFHLALSSPGLTIPRGSPWNNGSKWKPLSVAQQRPSVLV